MFKKSSFLAKNMNMNIYHNPMKSMDIQKKQKINNIFKWLFKNKNKMIMKQISPEIDLLQMIDNKTDLNLIKELFLENYFNQHEKIEIYIKLIKNIELTNFPIIKKALAHHINLSHKELSQDFIFMIEAFNKLEYWKIYIEDLNDHDLIIQDDLGYNIVHYFILWLDFYSSEIIELDNKIKEMNRQIKTQGSYNPFLFGNARVLSHLIIGTMGYGKTTYFRDVVKSHRKEGKKIIYDPIEILNESRNHIVDVEDYESDILKITEKLFKMTTFRQALEQKTLVELTPLDLAKEELSLLVKRIVEKHNLEEILNRKANENEKKSVKKI